MARYPIYAADFGQLGNQLQQDQAMQQRAIEVAQQNFQRARENQQQQQNYERKMAYQQALDRQALDRQAVLDSQNERYLNWQMGPGARVNQEPAAVRTDLFRNALEYVQQHGKVPEGTPEDLAQHLEPIAKAVQPELAKRHELLTGAADVINRRNALKRAIDRLDIGIKADPSEAIGQMGGTAISYPDVAKQSVVITKNLRSMRDKYANELKQLEPRVKMIEQHDDFSTGLQFDPRTRSVAPAYIPEFMNTNRPAGPRTATNAPTMKPLDRETAAQILQQAGGDPNAARLLARQLGFAF